jgi:hypothetical protein
MVREPGLPAVAAQQWLHVVADWTLCSCGARFSRTLTQLATAKAGMVLTNINPAYRPNELQFALKKVGCRGLVMSSQFKTSDYDAMIRGLIPNLDSCKVRAGVCKSCCVVFLYVYVSAR